MKSSWVLSLQPMGATRASKPTSNLCEHHQQPWKTPGTPLPVPPGVPSIHPTAPRAPRRRSQLRKTKSSASRIHKVVCANFFYFHIYITMCPLKGPNSKVAPFCIPGTQKSGYCTFTKALCFCKLRLWWISIRQTISKGMVTSIFPAYKQASFFPLTVQLQTCSTLITFRF